MSTGTDRIEIRNLLNPTPNCANSLKSAQSSLELSRSNWEIPIGKEQQEQPQGSQDNARFIHGVSWNIEAMPKFVFTDSWPFNKGSTKYGIDFDIFSEAGCASSQLVAIARPNSPSSNLMLRKGDEQYHKDSNVDSHIWSSLDDVRALRIAELVNDYRSLLIQIMERIRSIPLGDVMQYGYRVLQQNYAAAQHLLAGNPRSVVSNPSEEDLTVQFRRWEPFAYIPPSFDYNIDQLIRIILDASARRHQAHKIYLGVVAAEQWVLNLDCVVRKFGPHELPAKLQDVDEILHNVCFYSRATEANFISRCC